MGKWLDRLVTLGDTQKAHCQNCQKSGTGAFVGFVGADSGQNQKYPAVWRVILAGSGKDYAMTVIDPDRMPDDKFIRYLSDKFGADRVLSASRQNLNSHKPKGQKHAKQNDD